MKSSREYVPAQEIIQEVIDRGIIPIWERIENQFGEFLPSIVTIQRGETVGPKIFFKRSVPNPVPKAEIRLHFRKTFSESISLYFAEALFRPMEKYPGFSGFTAEGRVECHEDRIVVMPRSEIMRHNIWQWKGWL